MCYYYRINELKASEFNAIRDARFYILDAWKRTHNSVYYGLVTTFEVMYNMYPKMHSNVYAILANIVFMYRIILNYKFIWE